MDEYIVRRFGEANEQIELLLMSYGLTELLEMNDIEETFVLELLVEQGYINLKEYFGDD